MNGWKIPGDTSEPLISAKRHIASGHGARIEGTLRPTAVIFEMGYALDAAAAMHGVREEIPRLPCFLYRQRCLHLKGYDSVSFLQRSYGAPAAVDLLETILALGVKRIVTAGFCGGIGDVIHVGDIILTEEAIREEGTSYHYLDTDEPARPDPALFGDIRSFFASSGYKTMHHGKTVTTDAFYRETLAKERAWRDCGILGVDMETSALLSVARYYSIPAALVLLVSDKHDLSGNGTWEWGSGHFEEKKGEFLALFMKYVKTLES